MAVAAIAVLSSCSKSDSILDEGEKNGKGVTEFTATIEGNAATRTTVNTISGDDYGKVSWSNGDAININGVEYTTTSTAGTATFTTTETPVSAVEGMYKAYYPKSLYNGGTPTLPASYTYEAGKFNMPMYAESETTELIFQNICGVLAIKVTSAEMSKVTKITVTSDKAISGACTIASTEGKFVATATGTAAADKTLTLDCGTDGITPTAEGTTFYLPIPVISSATLQILVEGTISESKANSYKNLIYSQAMNASSVSVSRNKIYNINFATSLAKFSVSATKKVNFTKGNLWCNTTTNPVTWHLESNQYDYPTSWDTNHVGHFFWTKDASKSYSVSYGESSCTSGDVPFFAQIKVDDTSDLYALSSTEWKYLLNTSWASSGARTQYNRYAKANVNNKAGLLIFPDGYSVIVSSTGIAEVNSRSAAFPTSSIPIATWTSMESAGVVFLPASGTRDNYGRLWDSGVYGNYWSATPKSWSDAYFLQFYYKATNDTYIDPSIYVQRMDGYSIRLVRTASE